MVFFSVREIDGEKTNIIKPFIKEGVQSISTGHQWGMFNKMLQNIGYEVEHFEFMEVTSAKLLV